MRHLSVVILIFLTAVLGLGQQAVPAKQLSPLAEQLIANEKALTDAQKKRDVEFLKKTLADDFVSAGIDGALHPRSEVIGDAYDIQLKEYTPYNLEVLPLNDSAAVVTYDVIVAMAKYDEEIPRYQHVSSIWVKQGDEWRLKFQQATPHVF